MIIDPKQEVEAIQGLLRRHPVVGVIGEKSRDWGEFI